MAEHPVFEGRRVHLGEGELSEYFPFFHHSSINWIIINILPWKITQCIEYVCFYFFHYEYSILGICISEILIVRLKEIKKF